MPPIPDVEVGEFVGIETPNHKRNKAPGYSAIMGRVISQDEGSIRLKLASWCVYSKLVWYATIPRGAISKLTVYTKGDISLGVGT